MPILRLDLARARAGLTQEAAAEKLNVSVSTISRDETTRRDDVPASRIIQYAEAYGCGILDLFDEADKLTEVEAEYVGLLRQVPPDKRAVLLDTLKRLSAAFAA